MATVIDLALREQLLDRREKLLAAASAFAVNQELSRLLGEVDAALSRIETGTYGLCEVCREPVEAERLMADPLVRVCLAHLSREQRQALEEDLELAVRIQRGLLPQLPLDIPGWGIGYTYEPAELVSGDYCDIIKTDAIGKMKTCEAPFSEGCFTGMSARADLIGFVFERPTICLIAGVRNGSEIQQSRVRGLTQLFK